MTGVGDGAQPSKTGAYETCEASVCVASCRCGYMTPPENDPLCQCQGCGAWAPIRRLGDPHNCHRTEDGTYEEGGSFQ